MDYSGMSQVQEEFLRLMRAISDSLERESELQRQLRRTKESMVSVALQLQVSIKLSQEDEHTISSLLIQTEEAKSKELIAKSKSEEATSIVNQLNLEINALKRRLNALELDRGTAQESTGLLSVQQQLQMSQEADDEVDAMIGRDMPVKAPRVVSEKALQNATPFDRWKINQFLYSTDTPAASEMHDTHVVDMLIDAASLQLGDSVRRSTTAALAKLRRVPSHEPSSGDFVPPTSSSPTRKSDRDFFISDDVEQAWGTRSRLASAQAGFVRATGSRLATSASLDMLPRKKSVTAGTRLSALTNKPHLPDVETVKGTTTKISI